MLPTNIKQIIYGLIAAIVAGTYIYIQSLQSTIEDKNEIIHKQEITLKVDKKSDVAHDLTAELNTTMEKAKGARHEVEINTTIGHHSLSF